MKAQREVKKDPKRAVELIEKVLEDEPYNRQANLASERGGGGGGLAGDRRVRACRLCSRRNRATSRFSTNSAGFITIWAKASKEVEVYNRITEIDPIDPEAMRLGKDAVGPRFDEDRRLDAGGKLSRLDQGQGRWRFRSSSKAGWRLTGESLEQQIDGNLSRGIRRSRRTWIMRGRLGALYEQKEDFENAIAWYQYAADLTNRSDPGLVRKVSDLQMKRRTGRSREHETVSGGSTVRTRPSMPRKRTALAEAKKRQRAEHADRRRAEAVGTKSDRSATCVMNWANISSNAGQFREALPELQRARQNPNARLKAMNLLGRCYRELGMLDLAAKQLDEAAREITSMDAMKKEIVYNLGLVYEQMGEIEKSIGAMKQIYEADYGYRDVAARVESSYKRL